MGGKWAWDPTKILRTEHTTNGRSGFGGGSGISRHEASDTLFLTNKLSTLQIDADGIVRYASAALASYDNDDDVNT